MANYDDLTKISLFSSFYDYFASNISCFEFLFNNPAYRAYCVTMQRLLYELSTLGHSLCMVYLSRKYSIKNYTHR